MCLCLCSTVWHLCCTHTYVPCSICVTHSTAVVGRVWWEKNSCCCHMARNLTTLLLRHDLVTVSSTHSIPSFNRQDMKRSLATLPAKGWIQSKGVERDKWCCWARQHIEHWMMIRKQWTGSDMKICRAQALPNDRSGSASQAKGLCAHKCSTICAPDSHRWQSLIITVR